MDIQDFFLVAVNKLWSAVQSGETALAFQCNTLKVAKLESKRKLECYESRYTSTVCAQVCNRVQFNSF